MDNRRRGSRRKKYLCIWLTLLEEQHTIPCPKGQCTRLKRSFRFYAKIHVIDQYRRWYSTQYRRKWETVSTFFPVFLQSFQVFSADPFVQCICWWRCFLDCFLAFLRAFMTLLLAFNVTGDIMNRSTINEREIKELPVQMVLEGPFLWADEEEGIPRQPRMRGWSSYELWGACSAYILHDNFGSSREFLFSSIRKAILLPLWSRINRACITNHALSFILQKSIKRYEVLFFF